MNATNTASPTTSAPVNTAKVSGRRELHFNTLEEIQADAERLASGPVRQLGNWPLGYALAHMAGAMKIALDGATFRVPIYIRWFAPMFKKRLLRGRMQPGFKLPKDAAEELIPAREFTMQEGLAELQTAIARMNREPQRHPSPVFGKMTNDEWIQLHCRHAELHLSFYVPE